MAFRLFRCLSGPAGLPSAPRPPWLRGGRALPLWPRRRPQLAQPTPAPAGGHPALAPVGHPPPGPEKLLPGPSPQVPRPSPRATAPPSGRSPLQEPRCTHCSGGPAVGAPRSPICRPPALSSERPGSGSRLLLWTPGLRMGPGSAAGLAGSWGRGRPRGSEGAVRKEQVRSGRRGYSRLRTDGAGGGEV